MLSALEPTPAMATTKDGLWDQSDALSYKCSLRADEAVAIRCIFWCLMADKSLYGRYLIQIQWPVVGLLCVPWRPMGWSSKSSSHLLTTPDPSRASASSHWAVFGFLLLCFKEARALKNSFGVLEGKNPNLIWVFMTHNPSIRPCKLFLTLPLHENFDFSC